MKDTNQKDTFKLNLYKYKIYFYYSTINLINASKAVIKSFTDNIFTMEIV